MIAAVPTIRAVKAWSDLRASWVGSVLNPARSDAKARLAEINKYRAAFPSSPLAEMAKQYSDYLSQGLAAMAKGGPWLGQFSGVLHNRLLRELDSFSTSDGKTYFVRPGTRITEDTVGNDQIISFKAVTSADAGARTVIDLPVGVSLTTKKPVRSPQARLSRQLIDAIRGMSFNQWNTIGFKQMRILKSSSASPVVKGLLLSDVLVLNKPFLTANQAAAFSSAAKRLARLHLESVNWLNPDKPVRGSIVRGVSQAFGKLPDLGVITAEIRRTNASLAKRVDFSINALGIYQKTAAAMTIHSAITMPPANGDSAWVIVPGGSKNQLEKVGVMRAGKWALVPDAQSAIADGTLVFITSGGK
ncbi:MAG: hypothetical protein ACP5I8_16780 [Phycisphaerae bacterium]